MKTGFVICSRIGSSRLPAKVKRQINGQMLIENLLNRLTGTKIPVILAVPHGEYHHYSFLQRDFPDLILYEGDPSDPLGRMNEAAISQNLDTIIRVTHDKIFIEPNLLYSALDTFHRGNYDYLYSSQLVDGAAFEIISGKSLADAAARHKQIEFIGYAVRSVTDNIVHFDVPKEYRSSVRFLVDYPEDLLILEAVFSALGNDCTLKDAIQFVEENSYLKWVNRMPDITVYTCAYNASEWITEAMNSVNTQTMMPYCEYILVDDHSTDDTYRKMLKHKIHSKHDVKVIRNQSNIGLAASSNMALKNARGRYIIRLDADDHFPMPDALSRLFTEMRTRDVDVIYPNYWDGSMSRVGNGKESHHPAGAIFNTRALNHVKFTDSLRNYDGLDLYHRAKDQMKIGYLNCPIFFYRHTEGSMSRTNLGERMKAKQKILGVIDELTL